MLRSTRCHNETQAFKHNTLPFYGTKTSSYHDGDIHVSKIDINKKHPLRTKEECVEGIEFIEKLPEFIRHT
ncbi:MAG: hypothetical protein WBE68_19355 [Candidatus Nitrosopolaris sp.]